jgi:hypothetical protein
MIAMTQLIVEKAVLLPKLLSGELRVPETGQNTKISICR